MQATVLGRIGYDLYADEANVPLKDVKRFSRYLGGSSANIAVGLRRLGIQVGIISCVGADPLGDYLVEYLNHEGIDTRRVRSKAGCLSSLCFTEITPPDRFPQVFYRERAADTLLEITDEDREVIDGSELFVTNGTSLCASPSRESTYRAMEWAKGGSVPVAFDVDYRAMSWTSAAAAGVYARLALPLVDIMIANPDELRIVTETEGVDRGIDFLKKAGVSLVVAKLGSAGTKVAGRERSIFLKPYPVEVCSTIGAGDGFASGFLSAVMRGMPLESALQYGNAAAAIVVSRLMCSDAMPTREEVESLIAAHPDVRPVND